MKVALAGASAFIADLADFPEQLFWQEEEALLEHAFFAPSAAGIAALSGETFTNVPVALSSFTS